MNINILNQRYSSPKEFPSIPEVANLLADILDNPSHPNFCSHVVHGCRALLMQAAEPKGRDVFGIGPIVYRQHRFLDSIMHFLNPKNASKEHISGLMDRLDDCGCNIPPASLSRTFHGASVKYAKDKLSGARPSFHLMDWLFQILTGAIMLSSNVRNAKGENSRKWPTSSSSFLPHGVESFATSISAWTYVLPQPRQLWFATVALKAHGRTLAAAFIKSYSFQEAFLYKLREVVQRLKAHDPNILQVPHPSEHPLSTMAEFLTHLSNQSLSSELYRMFFLLDVNEFCQLLAESIRICRDATLFPVSTFGEEGFTYRSTVITSLQAQLLDVYVLPNRTADSAVVRTEINAAQKTYSKAIGSQFEPSNRFVAVGNILRAMKNSKACSVVSCEHSLQSAGKSFKFCSGCQIMPYCSVDCQRDDWQASIANGDYPHKKVCKAIQTFTKAAGSAEYMTQPASIIKDYDWAVGGGAVELLLNWNRFYTDQRESMHFAC